MQSLALAFQLCADGVHVHMQLSGHRWQLMEICETWEYAFSNTNLGWCYWRHHQREEARAGKHLHICECTCVLLNIPDCTLHWEVLGDSSLSDMISPHRFTPIITTETILTILQLALVASSPYTETNLIRVFSTVLLAERGKEGNSC